ncbi:MAG: futalosine hydrolase [Phycisphaeraceae bacterium]|nr:MAG: futalosine hydrolase [Phycisphaeraceae bacterium]
MAADERGILIVVAVGREARAVLDAFGNTGAPPSPWVAVPIDQNCGFDLAITGVGKANAAGAIVRCADRRRHRGVLNVGVCGSMDADVPVGACVVGTESVYADEGIVESGGYRGLHEMGFPVLEGSDGSFPADPGWLESLEQVADAAGPIATVSTCSGTDGAAAAVRGRTGAIAEAMEGAAIAQTLERVGGFRFAELRTVSNFTGDRGSQAWDLDGAFARLREVLGRLPGL